jgi:hypothetical protein
MKAKMPAATPAPPQPFSDAGIYTGMPDGVLNVDFVQGRKRQTKYAIEATATITSELIGVVGYLVTPYP